MSKLSDKLTASVRKAQSETKSSRLSAPPSPPPRRRTAKPSPPAAPTLAATAVTDAPRRFDFPDRVWPD